MSENNNNKDYNVMPKEITGQAQAAQAPSMMNGLTWLLGALLLVAIVAIIWMLVAKDGGTGVNSPNESSVVAIVNGKEIHNDKLVDVIPMNEKFSYIDRVIFEELIDQEVKKANISITDEELDAAVDLQMTEFDHMFYDTAELEMQLAMSGLTLEGLREDIRNDPNLLIQVKLEKLFEKDIVISDEQIAEYFAENEEALNANKKIHASHILVESQDLANSLLEQIRGGADFAELAKEHSTDGSSEAGGDLGAFGHGLMVQPFEEVAFSLDIGEVSDVVETEFGYHIIRLEGKQRQYNIEDDKALFKSYIFREEMNELFPDWMESVREAADIEVL